MLFDAAEGLPLALMDGGSLTAIRTAAASALATRALAREDSKILGVLGCGEEAHVHIPAMLAVRKFTEVLVWGRNADRAKAFVEHLHMPGGVSARAVALAEQVVANTDVICTVTSAATPILKGEWIRPGTHLNLVGSAVATTAEVDGTCVKRARFYVDYREAALAQAGELLDAIKAGMVTAEHIVGEIGEVLIGKAPGRRSADEITAYKSLGIAAQDLTAAEYVYAAARAANVGVSVELGS
jgi:ornithine cyclodeaminase